MHQDIQAFLAEVGAHLESQPVYEVLTAYGIWRRVRIAFIKHDYSHAGEVDAATINVIDLEGGSSLTLFGSELPARLRKLGELEKTTITQQDIEQVFNRDIIGRECEVLSGAGWLRSYVDEIVGDANWYHARIGIGRSVVLRGVEIVTRLRFPIEQDSEEK